VRSKIERLDIQSRGKYILETTLVESHMTNAIANHFFLEGDPKRSDLMSILALFTFRTKQIIYKAMLMKHYSDVWKEYSRDIKKLKEITDYRNRLAHWGSIPPPFGADISKVDYATLYHIGEPGKLEKITKQSHNAKLKELLQICMITEVIMNEIQKRRRPTSKRSLREWMKPYAAGEQD